MGGGGVVAFEGEVVEIGGDAGGDGVLGGLEFDQAEAGESGAPKDGSFLGGVGVADETNEDPSMLRFAGTSFGFLVWKRKR